MFIHRQPNLLALEWANKLERSSLSHEFWNVESQMIRKHSETIGTGRLIPDHVYKYKFVGILDRQRFEALGTIIMILFAIWNTIFIFLRNLFDFDRLNGFVILDG